VQSITELAKGKKDNGVVPDSKTRKRRRKNETSISLPGRRKKLWVKNNRGHALPQRGKEIENIEKKYVFELKT